MASPGTSPDSDDTVRQNTRHYLRLSQMLQIKNLNQFYGGSHILRNLSFEVPMGQVTSLLGRNGVGKTTLMKCLMGLIPAKSGTISFCGEDITTAAPHSRVSQGIGYVPQGREIFSLLTVEENLLMGLATQPRSSRIPDLVFDLFPVLKSMLGRRGGDLSGGQQQQLAIGRALAMNPKILILDEPTEGIQPSIIKDIGHAIRIVAQRQRVEASVSKSAEEREDVKDAIRKVAETGNVAILLVEQYYDFARDLADHYLLMERGEIIMRGLGCNMDKDGVREALAV
jgi:urea transport system ATP-binding protein